MDPFLENFQKQLTEDPSKFPAVETSQDPMVADPVRSTPEDPSMSGGTPQNDGNSATTSTSQVNWEELTGGKFKSWDEVAPIISEYETLKNAPQTGFADEAVKRFNDYVANGGKVDKEWMKKAFMDYDAIEDPYEILSEKFSQEGLTQEEIEYKLVSEYGRDMDPEGDSLEERAMRAKVKRESTKAKEDLKKYQNEVVWTVEGNDKYAKMLAEQEQQTQAFQKQMEEFSAKIDKDLSTLNMTKIPISVTDKDANLDINVEFETGDTKDVMTYVSNLTKNTGEVIYNRYKKDDGTFDLAKMASDEFKLRNFDEILKKVAVNAYSKGAKNEVLAIKNISALHKEEPINVTDLKTRQEQAVLSMIRGI